MRTVLILLLFQGCLGAFDTLFYHEFKLKLSHTPSAQKELILHAARDFVYALIFGTLAWTTYNGYWVWVLIGQLLIEIIITLLDFIEEDQTRRVPSGERIMHAVMGIVYGAFLACLLPKIVIWSEMESGFTRHSYGWMSWLATLMAAGVLISGIRDITAAWLKGNARGLLERGSV